MTKLRALFGCCVLSAAIAAGLGFAPADAFAQGKQKKPAEAKKSASAWVKLCDVAKVKGNEKGKLQDKRICLTHHERLDGNSGRVLVSAAVRDIEGQEVQRFLVMVPLGMAIPPGVQVRIDKEKPIKLKYTICHAAGCTAEITSTPELIGKLKKGKELVVIALNMVGKAVGFPISLTGFAKTLDGKAIDSKKYHAARKQLMGQIRKRQIELVKKAREASKKKQPAPKKN